MYAYDETEGLIECYRPKKLNHSEKPLMFIGYDGHFNPVPNDKRKSLTEKAKNNKGIIKSNDVETFEDKKTETEAKKYEVIAPTQVS